MRAYFDDTGTDLRSRIVGVAGWAAPTVSWISWESEWISFLAENELASWKQSDFGRSYVGRQGNFRGWSEAQWLLARRRIWEILSGSGLFGVGCVIIKSDYQEIVAKGKYSLPSEPNEFCLDRCLSTVLHRSFNLPHGEGIAIYCDQSKEQEEMGSALAAWHEKYVTLYADVGYRTVATSTTYGSRLQYISLQAADIVATEAHRACDAFLRGSTREQIDTSYPIIKQLRDRGCLTDVLAYSKADLTAEFERGMPNPARYGEKL